MDKLTAMRAFVTIAEHGSLTAAAQALGKAQPTMVRTLANLEAHLGTRLMRRTTRRLSLTDEGRDYLGRCRQILIDVEEAERALTSREIDPRGELTITAPVTFGQWHVAPAVMDFLKQHGRVRVELRLLDRVVDLLEEGIDLAVRIGELPDSTMVASQVGWMRRVVVASPELISRLGKPEHPQDLSDQPCVQFRGLVSGDNWQFISPRGNWTIPVTSPFGSNQALVSAEACVAGLGYGRFLAYQVAPRIRSGALQIVLDDFEPAPVPVSLVYTEARLMTPRLRTVLAFMKSRLADTLTEINR